MRLPRNVDTWERVASVAIGAGIVAAAMRRHRAWGAAAGTGAALIARGASGFCPVNAATGRHRELDDTRRALGGPRGVTIQESVTIAKPQHEIFAFWNDPANLPRFMQHIEEVTPIDQRRTHWVMRGPMGMRVEWDAEVINTIEPELIAWRSLPGADVASAGSVHFNRRRGTGTAITVRLQYQPPGGKAGAVLAWMAGRDPESDLREDLRRLKQILETGEVPTVDGQPAGRRNAAFSFVERVSA